VFTGKESGYVYSRYGNPTIDQVAQRVADMEAYGTNFEAYGLMCSSGMAAISTLMYALCDAGEAILTQADLYGGTTELFIKVLRRHQIHPVITNLKNAESVRLALQENPNIKVIYAETPANPTMDCIDLTKLSGICKEYNKILVVDNTFCTPLLQRPLALGADFVIHSSTKYLNGHGNSISGMIISQRQDLKKRVWEVLKLVGSTSNAWDAWLLSQGMKTLALRMKKHSENAMALASFLQDKKGKVRKVNYCGLESHPDHAVAAAQMEDYGGMLSFVLDADLDYTLQFINNLQLAKQAPTLGDTDTLVLHPASSSHLNVDGHIREEMGISDSMIRISTGIEDIRDIIHDFELAFSKI
jgi:methionine-gamma-lyase